VESINLVGIKEYLCLGFGVHRLHSPAIPARATGVARLKSASKETLRCENFRIATFGDAKSPYDVP
jgi:hypothetical protein